MINPADIVKFMNLKNKFQAGHPKFVQFLGYVLRNGIDEGTIIEITVTKPGADPVTGNIKVSEEDIELFNELKNASR